MPSVQSAFLGRHSDGDVPRVALRHRHIQQPLTTVLAQQLTGMAAHQPLGRRALLHRVQRGLQRGGVVKLSGDVVVVVAVEQEVAGVRRVGFAPQVAPVFPFCDVGRSVLIKSAVLGRLPSFWFQQFQQGPQLHFVELHRRGGEQ